MCASIMTINNKSSRLASDFVELICSPNSPKIKSSINQPSNDETVDKENGCMLVVVSETNNTDLDEDSIDISKISQNQTILDIKDEADDLPTKAASCHVSPK